MKLYKIKTFDDIKQQNLVDNYIISLKEIFKILYNNNLIDSDLKIDNVAYDNELKHFVLIDIDTYDPKNKYCYMMYRFIREPKNTFKNSTNKIINYKLPKMENDIISKIKEIRETKFKNIEYNDESYINNIIEKLNNFKLKDNTDIKFYKSLIYNCVNSIKNIELKNEIQIEIEYLFKLIFTYIITLKNNIYKLCMMLSFVYEIYNITISSNEYQYYNNMIRISIFENAINNETEEIYNIFINDILNQDKINELMKQDLIDLEKQI